MRQTWWKPTRWEEARSKYLSTILIPDVLTLTDRPNCEYIYLENCLDRPILLLAPINPTRIHAQMRVIVMSQGQDVPQTSLSFIPLGYSARPSKKSPVLPEIINAMESPCYVPVLSIFSDVRRSLLRPMKAFPNFFYTTLSSSRRLFPNLEYRISVTHKFVLVVAISGFFPVRFVSFYSIHESSI